MLFAWWLALLVCVHRSGRLLALEVVLKKQHYLQACVQSSLLLYWGWYWPPVYAFLPFILAQLVFAYAFDMLLVWSRRDTYTLGFAPFPVVVSINLFLWFKPDWFYLQFGLVALGLAAKGADPLEPGRADGAHLQSVVISTGGVSIVLLAWQERHHLGADDREVRNSIRRTCTWCCFCSACPDSSLRGNFDDDVGRRVDVPVRARVLRMTGIYFSTIRTFRFRCSWECICCYDPATSSPHRAGAHYMARCMG